MFKNLKRFRIYNHFPPKEPKKVLKMVLKTHLEPLREHLKVPPVGQPKNLFFFLRVYMQKAYEQLLEIIFVIVNNVLSIIHLVERSRYILT